MKSFRIPLWSLSLLVAWGILLNSYSISEAQTSSPKKRTVKRVKSNPWKQKAQTLEKQLKELQQQTKTLEQEKSQFQQQTKTLEQEKSQLQESNNQMVQTLEQEKSQLQESNNQMVQSQQEMKAANQQLETQVISLSAQVEQSKELEAILQEKLEQEKGERNQLTQQNQNLEEQLKKAIQANIQLKKHTNENNEVIESLRRELALGDTYPKLSTSLKQEIASKQIHIEAKSGQLFIRLQDSKIFTTSQSFINASGFKLLSRANTCGIVFCRRPAVKA